MSAIIKLSDINMLDVGNSIQLYGAIYSDERKVLLMPLPDEDAEDLVAGTVKIVRMDTGEWARFRGGVRNQAPFSN
jgi:hypothetical protein